MGGNGISADVPHRVGTRTSTVASKRFLSKVSKNLPLMTTILLMNLSQRLATFVIEMYKWSCSTLYEINYTT